MQNNTKLMGSKAVTRRTIAMQKELMVFDVILHLATTPVDLLVNPSTPRCLQMGHDITDVLAFIRYFDLADDSSVRVHRVNSFKIDVLVFYFCVYEFISD
jgi:hypothetical protein